jgi:hypothetical protein
VATQAGMVVLMLMVIRGRGGRTRAGRGSACRLSGAGAGGDDGGGRGAGGSGVEQESRAEVAVLKGSWLCQLATQMVVVVVVAVMVVVETGIRSVGAGVDADGAHRSTQDRRVSQTGI